MDQRMDLVVLGGGPAGAISALLAAREGLRVALVDPCRPRDRLEGFSPRLAQWLQREGLLDGFDQRIGPLRREVDWAGIGASNTEQVILRGAFDAHLRAAAVRAGTILRPASGEPEPGGVRLSGGGLIAAPRIIDARGRRPAWRGPRAPATLALCGWISSHAAPGIRLTAFAHGWVWRVALPDGRIWAQVMTDSAGSGRISDRLLAALASTEPRLDCRGIIGDVLAREAAPRLPCPITDLRRIPVGDALAATDPLSGHGQFWAVSSALAAAAVRRTLDARPGPETEALCRRFLTNRAAATALHQARIGRDFLRSEPRFADQPFWQRRHGFPDDLPAGDPPQHIAIRKAEVVCNGLVTEMEVLITPRSPGGVAWFGTLPAAPAWRAVAAGGEALAITRWGPAARGLAARIAAETAPAVSQSGSPGNH